MWAWLRQIGTVGELKPRALLQVRKTINKYVDYQKHYDLLISRSYTRNLDCYTEKHHIIPRCMGGSDDVTNLAELTPEEHYVAHQLLIKIYPDEPKLVFAAHMMTRGRSNNKLYGWLRKLAAEQTSKSGKRRTGKKNGSFGTRWICNIELQENKKISKDDPIPEGWIAGRNKWVKPKPRPQVYKCCWPRAYDFNQYRDSKVKAESLWEEYMQTDCVSVNAFAKKKNLLQQTVSSLFRKHIPAYSTKRRIPFKKESVA